MTESLLKNIPLTYMWFIRKLMDYPQTVLDLGCARGGLMKVLASRNWEVTGVDIDRGYLEEAKKTKLYKKLYQGDLVKICEMLVKQKMKYDLVFCSQVIEHLKKDEGEKLLTLCDKLAIKRIYFGTPNGYMIQPDDFIQGSYHQLHKSGWTISDFKARGYKVYGIGLLPVWSENGFGRSSNRLVRLLANILSYIASPVTYYIPRLAAGIMAIKIMK